MIRKGSHLREDCFDHGSCIGAALCSCNGVALCCVLAAGRPAHSALGCASRANLSGLFVFTGRLSLWKDESDGKLQESLVCSGIVGCVLLGSLLALAGIGDTLCWVVPKAWYAGESWRRPPLRTRGQGKTIRSTGERTQAKVRTCPVFTVFVPQCCVRLRRRPPSWRASLFALPMATF